MKNIELVAKAIEQNEKIRDLDLNSNGLGSANCQNMEFFANAIEKNKKLNRIYLRKNNMSEMNKKNLQIFTQAIENKIQKFHKFNELVLGFSISDENSKLKEILVHFFFLES